MLATIRGQAETNPLVIGSLSLEQRIKQRLVGAVVLVALAVIFLPMLLSGPVERTRVDIALDIPDEPVVDRAPALPSSDLLQTPEPGAELAEMPVPDVSAESAASIEPPPAISTQAPEPAPEPSSDQSSAPAGSAGLYVQVGAFGSAENADYLARQLRDDGFSVRVVETAGADRVTHRVQVGPLADREAAEQASQRLAEAHELPGFIIEP